MTKSATKVELDKIMERSPAEVRVEAKAVSVRYKDCWAELAKLLYRIKVLRDYEKWKYVTFEAYVEEELGLEARTVRYWLSIYDKLVLQLGVSESQLKGKAWGKIRYIVPVANKDNVDKWLEKAERLTQPELAVSVHDAIEGKAEKPDTELFTPISFRVSPDQRKTIVDAIEHAKKLSPNKNDHDAHALEMICLNFLGDNLDSNRDALVKILAKIESVFRVKTLVLDTDNPNWKEGFEKAREAIQKSSVTL
jgi:hypothetical protein